MRRLLTMLTVLAAVGAVAIFTLRRTGSAGERFPASRAAELAPTEAEAFLWLPDLERTRQRWAQSDVRVIAQEPEWQDPKWQNFQAKWWAAAAEDPDLGVLVRLWPELQRAEPAGFFIALTDIAATELGRRALPGLVGGFPFRGKKSNVESAVRVVKDHLLAQWPGATSELSNHDGIEIETIRNPTFKSTARPPLFWRESELDRLWTRPYRRFKRSPLTPAEQQALLSQMHFAYRDDWLFFASDRKLLTDTLDRYLRKPAAAKSLAARPDFVECRQHEVPEADLIGWEPWDSTGSNFRWASPALEVVWTTKANPPRAVDYSWRLDGAVRDRLYVQMTTRPQAGEGGPRPLANSAFSAGEAPANGVFSFNVPKTFEREGFSVPSFVVDLVPHLPIGIPDAAVAKHLRPGTMRTQREDQGWVVESDLNVVSGYLVTRWLRRMY